MYNSNFLPLFKELSNEEHIIADLCIQNIKDKEFSVLDIGIGNGTIGSLIKNKTSCNKLIGVEPFLNKANNYNRYDHLIQERIENIKFTDNYDYVILSHILGHISIENNFRYSKLLEKLSTNCNRKIFIATNAVIGDFKLIQNIIWKEFDDYSYYIDIEQLLFPFLNKYFIKILPFIAIVKTNNNNLLYSILEVFSPKTFPAQIMPELFNSLDKLRVNGSWVLQVPQFFITIELNNKKRNNTLTKEVLNDHEKIWENVFDQY
jgi:hypothetical protein